MGKGEALTIGASETVEYKFAGDFDFEFISDPEKKEFVRSTFEALLHEVGAKYGEGGKEPLPFHNLEHSMRVCRLAIDTYDVITAGGQITPQKTETDKLVIMLASAGHDSFVQTQAIVTKNIDGKDIRQGNRVRLRGWNDAAVLSDGQYLGNELLSANYCVGTVRSHDYPTKHVDDPTLNDIKHGIKTTLPKVEAAFEVPEAYRKIISRTGAEIDLSSYLGDGTKSFRIYQEFNNDDSSVSSMCIGLADLSYTGSLIPEESVKISNAEYRELNIQVMDELGLIGLDSGKLSIARKREITSSMLNWMKSQIQFGITQKYNFDNIVDFNRAISKLPDADSVRENLRKMYSHFNEYTAHQVNRYEQFTARSYSGTDEERLNAQIRDLAATLEIPIMA